MLCAQHAQSVEAVSSCTLRKPSLIRHICHLLRSEPLVLSTRHCIALSGRWPADIPQVRNLKPHIQIPSKAYIQSL